MGLKQKIVTAARPVNHLMTTQVLRRYYRSNQAIAGTNGASRVLVIAPHVDDETIGLGGTIKKHAQDGAEIALVYVTDGSKSTGSVSGKDLVAVRKAESKQVQEILGIDRIHYLDLPDREAESNDYVRGEVVRLLSDFSPDMIYCTPFVDCHPDHIAAGRILSDALKQAKLPNLPVRLYEINCPVPREAINCIIDITDTLNDKMKAIDVFQSQTLTFSGFLELNRLKASMVGGPPVQVVETFIELSADEFVRQFDRMDAVEHPPYQSLFTQASTRDKLLWAVYRNLSLKRRIYRERL